MKCGTVCGTLGENYADRAGRDAGKAERDMHYQGVFFDFDYTLGDSTVPITTGYQRGMEALGWPAPTVEQVRPTIGYTLMDGYTMLTGDGDPARRQAFYQLFQAAVGEQGGEGRRIMVEDTTLFPGARDLLCALRARGVRAALVSTKRGETIRRIFAYQGLEDQVDLILGGRDVSRPKPDPEGLNLALERLGLDRGQALFCGDTVIDAQAAQNAGVDFCAVLNGITPACAFEEYPHVHIAPDLMELRRWLEV